ncbi:MAG: 30S ribosomal protein S3 [Dehalococcoidia bacterium]|nr:30S ribosomal protein S3 [Dehalococcoidia bacterium]
MGHKVHPIGFRLGITQEWRSRWYSQKHYTDFVQEDVRIRKLVLDKTYEAGVSRIDIERWANDAVVTIHTGKPGIVIGRGGQRVDELRRALEEVCGKKVRLNIHEIREPELDAYLVARNIASQMEHQISYRRAIKRSMLRTMQAGAKGIKVICSGRLGGAEIARRVTFREGRVPLHTLRADIDYGFCEARTMLGRIGVKVWIYKGDVFAQAEELEAPAPPAAAAQQPAAVVAEASVQEKPGEVAVEVPAEVDNDAAAE